MNNDSTTKSSDPAHDWSRFDAMTEAERHAAAMADPDARPMTEEEWRQGRRTPRVKIIRRALRLSAEEFAQRYGIPLAVLADWEDGRSKPDETARTYLRVIAQEPDLVAEALGKVAKRFTAKQIDDELPVAGALNAP